MTDALVLKALIALQYVHHMHIGNKIATSIKQNEITAGVFLDLCKAFDTFDYHILFRKLESDGVCGLTLQWIKSYFSITPNSSRSPLSDTHCSEQIIRCGVPQGSILGPLFFILYINDLPKTTRLADTLPMILVSFTPIQTPLNMLPLSVIKHKNIFILYLNLSLFNLLYYSLVFYLGNKLKSHFSSSKTSCVSSDKFKSPCTLCTFLCTIEYPSHF